MNTYDYGDVVRLTATFRNSAGALTTPSSTVCRVKSPAGDITTPAATPVSAGVLEAVVSINEEGEWHYRFEGTSPTCAVEHRFLVRNSAFY